MRPVRPIAWATMTPRTSIGSTKAASVSHPCATCNGCGKGRWQALANKRERTALQADERVLEEVGREGIEPSWVAPGDFKSPASTISPPPQADIGSPCA